MAIFHKKLILTILRQFFLIFQERWFVEEKKGHTIFQKKKSERLDLMQQENGW